MAGDGSDEEARHQALADYVRRFGGGDPGRAALWDERLKVNQPEIDRLLAAPAAAGPAYVAVATPVLPPRAGQRTTRWDDRQGPDAATALARARSLAHGHLTTQLVAEVPAVADGYLNGMPIAVKDLIGVAGLQRTGGSASEPTTEVADDAACVAALRRHGGVIIGLANLHELALGANSVNPVYGAVVNPAAPDRIPGGSSGGSAALVAAGVVPVALGSDTGGSIRIPAACCGVVGFKPSHGAVALDGVMRVGDSLDTVGPIGRTVADCALVYAALSDCPRAPELTEAALSGLRVGRLTGHFEAPLDDDVQRALDAACRALTDDGGHLSSCLLAGAEDSAAIYFATVMVEAAGEHAERVQRRAGQLGDDIRLRLEAAMLLPGHLYIKAQRMRRQLAANLDALFGDADVLLCATMRAPAPRRGETTVTIGRKPYALHAAMADLTLPFSLAGLPALSLPWGRTHDGVPIGLQLVGARGSDWRLLEVAHRFEQLRERTAER